MTQVKVKGSGRLFNNPILEMLTKTHPAVILSMYIPFCAFLLWYFYNYINPSVPVLALTFFIGVFSWTFFEYILHRYVFHWVSDSGFSKRFVYMVHGVHHEYPKDTSRLVMPPIPSMIIAALLFTLFWVVLRLFHFEAYVTAYFSGFIIGYLAYAMIHFSMHAFRPPKNRLKFLWEYHNVHHYKYPDKAYGVSSPLWDYIFRTVPPKQSKQGRSVSVNARG